MTFSSRAGLATGSVVVGGNEEAFPIASIDNSGDPPQVVLECDLHFDYASSNYDSEQCPTHWDDDLYAEVISADGGYLYAHFIQNLLATTTPTTAKINGDSPFSYNVRTTGLGSSIHINTSRRVSSFAASCNNVIIHFDFHRSLDSDLSGARDAHHDIKVSKVFALNNTCGEVILWARSFVCQQFGNGDTRKNDTEGKEGSGISFTLSQDSSQGCQHIRHYNWDVALGTFFSRPLSVATSVAFREKAEKRREKRARRRTKYRKGFECEL